MRICHIISGDLYAGAEVMNYRLLKGLLGINSIELSAILFNEGKLAGELRKLGIPVDVVDENRLNFYQMMRECRKVIARRSPDIIHSHRLKENVLAYLSVKSHHRKIPMVSTHHGMPEPVVLKHKKVKEMILSKYHFYILSKYFRYVIAVSEDIRISFIHQYGIPEGKVTVVYNGTEISNDYSGERKREYFVIGSAGRLFPVKDYTFMAEIAREVLKRTDRVRFELAGDGPDMEKLEGLIREYNIEEAFLLRGFIHDMESFYRGLDLFINTSIHEGIPMSVLEAMALGLPVVAPDVGGLKEILTDGVEGFLVKERVPWEFAVKCLSIYQNSDLRNQMAAAARRRIAEDFSVEKMAKNYFTLYQDAAH